VLGLLTLCERPANAVIQLDDTGLCEAKGTLERIDGLQNALSYTCLPYCVLTSADTPNTSPANMLCPESGRASLPQGKNSMHAGLANKQCSISKKHSSCLFRLSSGRRACKASVKQTGMMTRTDIVAHANEHRTVTDVLVSARKLLHFSLILLRVVTMSHKLVILKCGRVTSTKMRATPSMAIQLSYSYSSPNPGPTFNIWQFNACACENSAFK
jgi:hypothetical protein